MVKRNRLPGERQLDMRPTKKTTVSHRPPILISSQPSDDSENNENATQMKSYFDLNALTEENRRAFLTYPTHLRASIYTAEPNVTIEPFSLDDSLPDTPRKSPRKRKERSLFNQDLFQKTPSKGRGQKSKEKEHTPEGDDLQNRPTGSPSTYHKIHHKAPGRQLGQKVSLPKRLTDEQKTMILDICIARGFDKFSTQTSQHFWERVSQKFKDLTDIPYRSTKRIVDKMLVWRKHLKKKQGSGHAARDDDLTQAIDQWQEIIDEVTEEHTLQLSQKEQKTRHGKAHDLRRDRLNERLGNKKKKRRRRRRRRRRIPQATLILQSLAQVTKSI